MDVVMNQVDDGTTTVITSTLTTTTIIKEAGVFETSSLMESRLFINNVSDGVKAYVCVCSLGILDGCGDELSG